MRISITLFYIFFYIFTLHAGSAIVSGKVNNAQGGELVFQNLLEYFSASSTLQVNLAHDGSFRANVQMTSGAHFLLWFKGRSRNIYLRPGEEVSIQLDANTFPNGLEVKGALSPPNAYLAEREQIEMAQTVNESTLFTMEASAFQPEVLSYRERMERPFQTFKQNYGKQFPDFVAIEEAELFYKWATLMVRYAPHHASLSKKNVNDVWAQLDQNALQSFNFSNSSLLNSKTYRDFLFHYTVLITDKELVNSLPKGTPLSRTGFFSACYRNISKLFSDKKIIEYVKARTIYEACDRGGLNGMEDAFDDLRAIAVEQNHRTYVQSLQTKWGHLRKGATAPDFTGIDAEGKTVKLSDLKGKLVYIDVWATWCGPCRREAPVLEGLIEKYKNSDIVFLSVSIDNDENTWKRWLNEKQPKGLHIFTKGGWGAPINKLYNITGIPRFLFIDKQGNIISANEDRPTQGAEAAILKALGN